MIATPKVVKSEIIAKTDNWLVTAADDGKIAFPTTKDGTRIAVVIPCKTITCCHRATGHSVTFRKNKVNWWDSRSDKPVARRDVIAEVARMGAGNMAGFLVRTRMGR